MQQRPMERYRHTQVGYLMLTIGVVAMTFAAIGLRLLPSPQNVISSTIALAAGVVLIVFFGSLRVIVRDGELEVQFGIGLLRKRFPLRDYVNVSVIRNHWYYGWGIRYWPGCALYSVSGLDAVQLERSDGVLLRIGTDDPQALSQALTEAIRP